jgi:hypothetical protein
MLARDAREVAAIFYLAGAPISLVRVYRDLK